MSPYVPGVPGHTQFLAQIRVKTYVGTPSFLRGHTQFLSLTVPENAGAHPLSKTWLRPWVCTKYVSMYL